MNKEIITTLLGLYSGTVLYWSFIPGSNDNKFFCKTHDPFNFMKKIATFGITSYYAFGFSQKFVQESEPLHTKLAVAFASGFLFDGMNSHNKASVIQGLGGALMAFMASEEYQNLQLFYQENREFVENYHRESERNLTQDIGWSNDSSNNEIYNYSLPSVADEAFYLEPT